MPKTEDFMQQLRQEQNKTAKWIEFFHKRLEMLDHKLDRVIAAQKQQEDKSVLLAQGILKLRQEHLESAPVKIAPAAKGPVRRKKG